MENRKQNVLLLGSGGREHAIAWKLAQSPILGNFYAAPGNPGIAQYAQQLDLNLMDNDAIIKACQDHGIDMVVVGPEAPLVNGVHDALDREIPNLIVIGPKKDGALLEGSKDFSKQFMAEFNIPTARYRTFERDSLEAGYSFLEELKPPYVLKCDGLAAGKGVLIVEELDAAKQELGKILQDGHFGEAGAKVVIEEFLDGTELSCFILCDGKNHLLLPTAKDYKRIGEGDTGLNTGGMGALSPAPVADDAFMKKVQEKIIDRSLLGLQRRGIDYKGFLFIGLMRVGDEPYVIEYNVRLGDPETEAVLPRVSSDLLAHFHAVGKETLEEETIEINPQSACTVMMVSGGYPGSYEKGKEINGLDKVESSSIVFQAGTKKQETSILSNGGRVLTITTLADNLDQALEGSYAQIDKISFEGAYFRKDIGYELKKQVR